LNTGNFTAVSVSELVQMLGQKKKVIQVLFSEVIKLATLSLPTMLKCVVRTCILNPSPPEDLVQKYIGAETVDAFSTDDNELRHPQESEQS